VIGPQGVFILQNGRWQSYLKKVPGKAEMTGKLLPNVYGKIYAVVSLSGNRYVGA
jgi:hypothetical protein